VNSRQAGGFAPIQEAALLGRRDLIDLLLDNGAEIAARANDGRNAVSEAERGKHPEIAAYLRTRGGADPRVLADLSAEPKD
jgi:ankyrin repeat protein